MAGTPYDPGEIRKLAEEIAARIADLLSQSESGEELLAARRTCPPKKLCCFNGYNCHETRPFWCDDGFSCTNGFSGVHRAE